MDWPWNPEKEKLTEPVLMEIAKNLPSYASDAIDHCSKANDERDLLGYVFVYFHVVKEEYFEATVKNLKGSMREEARKIASEAFDLIDLIVQWANTRSNAISNRPPNIFARWDTVVRKWDLLISTGKETVPSTNNDIQKDIPGEYRTTPMSQKELAELYGGSMTPKRIASMVRSGALNVVKSSRQNFTFDKRQLPKRVTDKLSQIE